MFLKTKLVVLGMLSSLTLLILVTLLDHSGQADDKKAPCANKKLAKSDCPLPGIPSCEGVTAGPFGAPCEFAKGSTIYQNRFPASHPYYQSYETHKGFNPISPPIQVDCYDLHLCNSVFDWIFLVWYCETDNEITLQRFKSIAHSGEECP